MGKRKDEPPYDELRRRESRYRRGYYYYHRRAERNKKIATWCLEILKPIVLITLLYELIK